MTSCRPALLLGRRADPDLRAGGRQLHGHGSVRLVPAQPGAGPAGPERGVHADGRLAPTLRRAERD